ncbi:MAG: type II toxin-antitoxin system YafQ family toxin [Planctomycetaceae bacterium]|nr:type II toxin-antitoxin system YafQ family toxin [Planctomycetaceae bacterium]
MLLQSSAFVREARRVLKKRPDIAANLEMTFAALMEDAFQPGLKSHKLKGDLAGSWACSAGYDLRIIFEFVQQDGAEAILLQSIGTHDEVY